MLNNGTVLVTGGLINVDPGAELYDPTSDLFTSTGAVNRIPWQTSTLLKNGDVLLVQEKYARDVISRFNMEGSKPVSTPLELGTHLDSSQQPTTDVDREQMCSIPYRSAIGSLMYLSTCTRPDISAAVSELSKFSQNPGAAH